MMPGTAQTSVDEKTEVVHADAVVADAAGALAGAPHLAGKVLESDSDERLERRVVWKIDLLLMPLLSISYGLQFYDKFLFSSAAVFGLLHDLDLIRPVPGTNRMSTERYSTASAAFYWGYIIGVIPMALALLRLPVAKALSALVFTWGIIVLVTITVTNYPGAVAVRFFLGLIEASVSPGFIFICSMWYTPRELPFRIGIWYSATGLFVITSGALNWAIGHVDGALAPWKYMYIVAGCVTIGWSLVLLALLPDTPARAPRWLFTPAERVVLAQRTQRSAYGGTGRRLRWAQAAEAARDWRVWAMGACGAAIFVVNGGVTAFGSIIIQSFGYSNFRAILLQMPGAGVSCVFIWGSTYLAGRFQNSSTILFPLACLPVLAGSLIIWKAPWSPHFWPVLGCSLLPAFGAPYSLLMNLSTRNVRGGTKRACAVGALFVGYNVGNIIGPYLVDTKEAPEKYKTTWLSICITMAFTIVVGVALRISYIRENARRDREQAAAAAAVPALEPKDTASAAPTRAGDEEDGEDLTDWEDRSFRYSL